MTTISSLTHLYEGNASTVAAARASDAATGLGPNQLKWLRGRIDSFKELEDQRRMTRQDAVRAARIAGLI
jgi:hypothetical protein